MSRYQKIYTQIWHDEKFLALSEDAKYLFLYCMTSPHSNAIGIYVLPKMYICADLKWQEKRLTKPFGELLVKGFIEFDETVNLLLLCNHLKHNSIENSNQLTGALKIFSSLPYSPKIILRMSKGLGKGFTKGFTEQFIKALVIQLPEGLPNSETVTETVTETETETETGANGRVADLSAVCAEIIDDLNLKSGKHFKPTKDVQNLINARLRENFTKEDFVVVHTNMTASVEGRREI